MAFFLQVLEFISNGMIAAIQMEFIRFGDFPPKPVLSIFIPNLNGIHTYHEDCMHNIELMLKNNG